MANENLNETTFANFRRELQTLNYAELNYLMSDIMLEIKKRSYNEGMVKAMTSGVSVEQTVVMHEGETVTPKPKSPQQVRDEIIEKAKTDITYYIDEDGFAQQRITAGKLGSLETVVIEEFIVNREKRTVVVLGFNVYGNRKKRALGIAKCDPSDCFNAHIGKAIALRRALGLEVPSEYLNAPQPTEARIGDVVRSLMSGTVGTKVDSKEGQHTLINDGIYYTLAHSACNVIDDSREAE